MQTVLKIKQNTLIRSLLNTLGKIIYPSHCLHCNVASNSCICLGCEYQLRKFVERSTLGNLFYSHFFDELHVSFAASLYPYIKKGIFQTMIHSLKYKSDKKVGKFIGQQMGNFLNQKQVNRPDVIIPVPLHPKKQMKRGYNQAEILAEGIQEIINIPIDKSLLLRKEHSRSQTTKSKKERISSLEDVFSANKEKTDEYNHVLLVDDVITTGATLRACINALTRHKNIKISILVAGAGQ